MRSHVLPTVLLLMSLVFPARASELGPLLEKLAEKGVISSTEAAALAQAPASRRAVILTPELRLRYQYEDNSVNPFARSRGRYSLRLGAETGGGPVRLFAGLAGGSDAGGRSTNQSFGRNMEKKNVYINYAYAEYAPSERLILRGGRMNPFLWDPTDMVWDSDLKPEGAAALVKAGRGAAQFFASAGFAALGESLASPDDPYLLAVQPGFSYGRKEGGAALKAALAYYAFGGVKGGAELAGRPSAADGYPRSNSAPGGRYAGGYDAWHASLEAGWWPRGGRGGSVFGEYIRNTARSGDSRGWIAGFRAGSRKPEAAGEWQFVWSLRRLEAEAWLDTYPDSDFYGGATGVQGAEASLAVALGGGVTLGLDHYAAGRIPGPGSESLLQADLSFRL